MICIVSIGAEMQSFPELPPSIRMIWAKSGELPGHGLLNHMLDVAAVAQAIMAREPSTSLAWLGHHLGLPSTQVAPFFAAVAGLHDFGKAIPGFQAKWKEGQEQDEKSGLPFSPSACLKQDRHDLATAALLRPELQRLFPDAGWVRATVQALGAHHGYFASPDEIKRGKPLYEPRDWLRVRAQLFDAYWAVVGTRALPQQDEFPLAAIAWLAGLTSLADWIGSNQDWFPSGERGDSPALHFASAQSLADRALDEIGWPRYRPLLDKQGGDAAADTHSLIGLILGDPRHGARPLQAAVDRLLARADGAVLAIVEAPMGEGKTELAFLAHLRLQAANGHRGLYVALPTQATGNAMYERTRRFLDAFSTALPIDVQLAHGGAFLRLLDVNGSKSEAVEASSWFAQRKRPLLAPYGVGTIDQALFATLNVKHHFVRLWGLANRVVVLDEVHAYDTYTSGLIEALLRWLKAMNCSVILMSATLPDRRRADFLRAWGAGTGDSLAYPRLLLASASGTHGEHVPCRALEPVWVTGIDEALDTFADVALEKLSGGGCGVAIVNTVQRAQQLFAVLKARIGEDCDLLLFHARYPADERAARESMVLERFGRDGKRPPRALLIATQVVEQSLDLDFDFMVSDLAPVDLLLQRSGRLHRHTRERPAKHRQPHLIVAGFQQGRMPELTQTAWGFVYDPYVLYRTWAIAGAETTWNLPADIDRLVQAVYANDPFAAEEREDYLKTLDQALGKHLADLQEQRQHAHNVALEADAAPADAYLQKPRANEEGEGLGRQVVTRLGEESLSIVPVHVGMDGWRLFAGDAPFDPRHEPDTALARRIFSRQLRVSRKDIVKTLLAQPATPAFESSPLLRNLRPLQLVDGVVECGRLRVRLDPELGLIYETKEET